MIANFFNKSKPANVFNVVLILFGFYIVSTILREDFTVSVLYILNKIGLFLWFIFYILIANFIIKKNSLTQDNSFALLIMVFLFATFPKTLASIPLIFTNICLLLAFRKVYSLKSNLQTSQKLFDAGLWIGIAALFSIWSLLFLWLVISAIFIYKKVQIKHLIIPFVGVGIPVLLYFTYHLYFESLSVFYQHFRFEYLFYHSYYAAIDLQIPLIFYGILLALALLIATPRIVLVSNKLKFAWYVYLNHLLVAMAVTMLIPFKDGSELLFLVFPVAIGIANYMEKWKSNFFQNLLLYLAFSLSVGLFYL